MLQPQKTLARAKIMAIAAIAISLAACSPGAENTNNSNAGASPASESATDTASPASSSSAQSTDSSASASISEINEKEIKFKPTTPDNPPGGGFDGINDSAELSHEVPKASPVRATGWAVLAAEGRPADMVIITTGDNNSLVAVAPVRSERQDVAKALKAQAYKNSGWSADIDPSKLPASKAVLKAWAYNSASKEAIQLGRTHEIIVGQ